MAHPQFIRDPIARFWSRIDRTDGCWIWQARRNPLGYGVLKLHGRIQLAHRVAWTLTHGPIPDGLCVLHRCDNPPCCNAAGHLFLGTRLDNTHDMLTKGRDHYLRGDECYQRQHPDWNRRGEQLTWAKLTDHDVRIIRASYAAGVTIAELARQFGRGYNTIFHVVHRHTWTHVE